MRRLGLIALLLIAALGAGAGWLDSQISRPYRGHRPEKVFVDVPRGTSRLGVAHILRKNDVIRSELAFAIFSMWHFRKPLQAGEYYIDRPFDSREVFWQIAGGRIYVRNVTIPEGWNMFEMAAELDRQAVCTREGFLDAAKNASLISDLAPNAANLEGFLFPSTYQFNRRTTCDSIAKRMVQNFRAELESLDPSGARNFPQGLTLYQVVTLASLVERETPKPEERPMVAGVFYNRLRKNLPLQCDPTVQYALELEGHHTKNVRPADLHIDSSYNTYEHAGLPPGPIANPGEASLRAAMEPTTTEYMYFVANDQGGHFFAKTLAEHNHNVARYRHLLAGDSVSADPAKPKHRGPS